VDWITQKLQPFGNRIVCSDGRRDWTYTEFLECIDHITCSIRAAALPPGSVVSIETEYAIEGIAAIIASMHTQLIAVPLPRELPEYERSLNKKIAQVEWSLTSQDGQFHLCREALPSGARPALFNQISNRQHAGLILYSSGTSGQPKAMLHDLNALLARYESVRPRSDRSLLLLLIDHIGGLDCAFRTLFAGSTLIIPTERTPAAVGAAIARQQVTIFPASPTFLNLMLLAKAYETHDCSSIEIIAYGAEAMPQSLLNRIACAFPRAELQQKFGTSETGSVRIKSSQNNSLFFKISDRDTEWKVVNEELWLKTPSRILGYLNADETSLEADGWYRTGDLVEEGSDDDIRIIGRHSNWMNIGGQKVHPAEIETVIRVIPGVTACRVFSKPAPITGSAICCEIVSAENCDIRAWKRIIRNHCKGKLAPWKIPSSVIIATELTMNQRMKRV
jgi:acyl-CoA synthetase (AMP-forming)/AMP-acid ligase II